VNWNSIDIVINNFSYLNYLKDNKMRDYLVMLSCEMLLQYLCTIDCQECGVTWCA